MRRPEAMVRRGKSVPPLGILVEQLATQWGLDFLGERQERLLHVLQEKESQAPHPPHSGNDTTDLAILLPQLVVGETYFQRDPETMDALLNQFLTPLIARRRESGQRYLRLWSAACCTGEEAYTLMFAVEDLLGAEREHWQLEIFASDLNPAFVAHAEQGVYGDYAFRQSSPAWRARYFTPFGKAWQLQPAWHGQIRFMVDNLVQPACGSLTEGNFDLILCRNVLMYFTQSAVSKAISRLLALRAPEGLLVVAAAEAGLARNAGWQGELLGQGYAVANRRLETQPITQALERRLPIPAPRPRPIQRSGTEPPQKVPVSMAANPLEAIAGTNLADRLATIRRLADQGQRQEAEQSCRSLILAEPLCIQPYWLLALYRFEAGDPDEALACLRKLHYLDPAFALAPYLEAQIYQRLGQRTAAARAKRSCLHILAEQADDQPVTEGEGLSAVQLRQLCLALDVEQP